MFRLQRRAVAFTRIGDRGGEVPDVRSEHRPPNPFYPSCGLPRHKRHKVFKSLRYLRPAPKALRSILVALWYARGPGSYGDEGIPGP
jgi:hypothetical protein